jgi:hypothetical protein
MDQVDNYLDVIQEGQLQEIEPVTMAIITGVFYASSVLNIGLKAYKTYFTKAARRCKDLPPQEKSLCMLNAKMLGKKAELAKLQGGMGKCSKVKKGPEKCVIKLKSKISKVNQQLQFLQKRVKQLGKQQYKGD